MKIGDRVRTRIDEVIRLHDKLLSVLSATSIDRDWIEKEVEIAFEKEREGKRTVLFPVRLDKAAMKSKTGWRPTSGGLATSATSGAGRITRATARRSGACCVI